MSKLQAPTTMPDPEHTGFSAPARLAGLRLLLLRRARRAVHDSYLAEDLVQDTLVAAFRQFPQYRGDASIETWATAILKRKVADWYRSPGRRRFVNANVEEGSIDPGADESAAGDGESVPWAVPAPDTESLVEQRETMRALERCVRAMPQSAGRALMLHDWQGYTSPEVCERLAVSRENLHTLLHRARKTVRECIQRDWIDCKGRRDLNSDPAAPPSAGAMRPNSERTA